MSTFYYLEIFAIEHLLSCHAVSGKALEIILGHCTWAFLCRRELLCIFVHIYQFIRDNYNTRVALSSDVLFELRLARAVLPLAAAQLDRLWSSVVYATDASLSGYGVCERTVNSACVGDCGRLAEKWRYDVESAIDARAHAMTSGGPEDLSKFSDTFCEVSSELWDSKDWRTVCSRRWRFPTAILHGEALAALWALKRITKTKRSFNVANP